MPLREWIRWWFAEKRMNVSISMPFEGIDASLDECRACGTKRRYHVYKDHKFVERKEA